MQQREFQDVNKQAALKIPFNSKIQIVLINAMALGQFLLLPNTVLATRRQLVSRYRHRPTFCHQSS
eukprot:scaffold7027_cov56-Cylindrotheca_fusiformis.AAC.1